MTLDEKLSRFILAAGKPLAWLKASLDRRLLSLCVFQTWIFLIFHSSLIIMIDAQVFGFVYTATLVFAVLTLVVGVFLTYHRRSRVLFLLIGTLCGSLATLSIYLLPGDAAFLLLDSALLGIATGAFIPFVGKVFSSASLAVAIRQTFLSFSLSVLLYFLILGLPIVASVACAVALPVIELAVQLSVVMISPRITHKLAAEAPKDQVRELVRSRVIVIFFLGVFLLGVAFGFSLAFCSLHGSEVFNTANIWAVLMTGVIAIAYSMVFRRASANYDFERSFSPVAPVIVIGLLLLSYSPLLSGVFTIAGFQLADMTIWIVLVWIAGHSGLPQRAFCIGKGCMYGGMLAGSLAVRFIEANSQYGSLANIIATIVTYLLVIAIVFVFNNSKVTQAIKMTSSDSDFGDMAKARELRCDALAAKYGLTKREREMLLWLIQGYSLPFIEEKMHISHSTANTHRDHIYSKLGIHSRQQLLDPFFDVKD
jgi:DNA-binding CsgD family transcriptional regulator